MTLVDMLSRVTRDETEFEAQRSSDRSAIFVGNGADIERYSIELSVGDNWSRRYGPASNQMVVIGDGGVPISVGESIVIEVAEPIRVPYNLYGLIIPTGRLFLDKAIIIAAAKIEPSFNGRLKLRLVNASGEARSLKRGDKIASAIFFATENTVATPDVNKTIVQVHELPSAPQKAWTWAKANPSAAVAIVAAIVSVTCSVLTSTVALALYQGRLGSDTFQSKGDARNQTAGK